MFVCRSCEARSPRWSGRCTRCGAWGELEAAVEVAPGHGGNVSGRGARRARPAQVLLRDVATDPPARRATGFSELDRVLGGGAVPGSTILLGGEPGIGKSTLLLAAAAGVGERALYVAGEEAPRQIALRARRLGVADGAVTLLDGTDPEAIATAVLEGGFRFVVVDSVQSMRSPGVDGVPGGPAQVRRAAEALVPAARAAECVMLLVGQVTKVGGLAGPRFLEHAVDTVVFFEGDRHLSVRALRGIKNRYGPTDEIGLFEMRDDGLHELRDASSLLLADRGETGPGSVIACVVEGRRAFCIEVQALLTGRDRASARRRAQGMDAGRLELIVGLVETRFAPDLGTRDAYLNVVGGLRVEDRGLDLAVAAAVLGAQLGFSSPEDAVFVGELGLRGELRPVPRIELRLKEARAMGFRRAFVPRGAPSVPDIRSIELGNLADLLEHVGTEPALPGPRPIDSITHPVRVGSPP